MPDKKRPTDRPLSETERSEFDALIEQIKSNERDPDEFLDLLAKDLPDSETLYPWNGSLEEKWRTLKELQLVAIEERQQPTLSARLEKAVADLRAHLKILTEGGDPGKIDLMDYFDLASEGHADQNKDAAQRDQDYRNGTKIFTLIRDISKHDQGS